MGSGESRGRRWAFRGLAVLLGVGVALGVAEGVARWVWTRPESGLPVDPAYEFPRQMPWGAPHMVYDDALGFRLKPGFQGIIVEPESRAHLRVNRLGLRGPEVPRDDTGRFTWLVVGDSFALSAQVEEEQTFPRLLHDRLGTPVLNGGVDSYSTWQATRWYARLDEQTRIDGVILLFFSGNDFIDNTRELSFHRSPLPDALQERSYLSGLADRVRGAHPILGRSRLFARWKLRNTLLDAPDRDDWIPFEISLYLAETCLRAGEDPDRWLSPTLRALRELRDEVAERGDRLVVAHAPPLFQVDPEDLRTWLEELEARGRDVGEPDPALLPRLLAAALAQEGIAWCDLAPALRACEQGSDPCYFRRNRHWTPRGHAVVARALADCLARLPAAGTQGASTEE